MFLQCAAVLASWVHVRVNDFLTRLESSLAALKDAYVASCVYLVSIFCFDPVQELLC